MYINYDSNGTVLGPSYTDKVKAMKKDGAREIEEPMFFTDDLILIGDNVSIGKAWGFIAYIHSEKQLIEWKEDIGEQEHMWLKYEHAKNTAR